MTLIHIDPGLCEREGACIESCPYSLFVLGEDRVPVEVDHAFNTCIRCGQCVAVCSTGALDNTRLNREEFREISRLREEEDPMAFAMLTRRSIRSFRKKSVPKAELKALLDVVRYAPTGNNAQNLWWIVTADPGQTRALALLARQWMRTVYWPDKPEDQWPEDDDPVLRHAPHLLLCCAPAESKWAWTDAAIALTHLDLLAHARGLGACWAGVFMRAVAAWPPLAQELGLPKGQAVFGGLFLGYPKFSHHLVPPRKPSAVDWR